MRSIVDPAGRTLSLLLSWLILLFCCSLHRRFCSVQLLFKGSTKQGSKNVFLPGSKLSNFLSSYYTFCSSFPIHHPFPFSPSFFPFLSTPFFISFSSFPFPCVSFSCFPSFLPGKFEHFSYLPSSAATMLLRFFSPGTKASMPCGKSVTCSAQLPE